MRNNFDDQIETISISYARQQGLSFATHAEAQQYLKKTKKEICSCIQQGNSMLLDGLTYLQEKQGDPVHSYVSATASKLLKHLDSSKKTKKIIEEILDNEHSLSYFSEVIKAYMDCGDDYKERCVYSVLLALFPLNPQGYICFGSLIWRAEGIASADRFYTKVTETLQDPALYYFAADCFVKNGDSEKAKEILKRALNMLDSSDDAEARYQVCEFLNQI